MKLKYSLILLALLISKMLVSQQIKTHSIDSDFLGNTINYRVALPNNYAEHKTYSPIFVLDGELLFFQTVATATSNAMYDVIPEAIVISIDYNAPNNRGNIGFVTNDLSTTKGGEMFKKYILEELIKSVESKYNVAKHRTIIGYSYTATYLLNWMMNNSDVFSNYILITPEAPAVAIEKASSKINSKLNGKRVVLLPAKKDTKARISFAKDLYKLMSVVNPERVDYKLIDTEHHTAPNIAVNEALPIVFKDYINEAKLNKSYYNKKSLSTNTKVAYEISNKKNMDNYGVTLPLNSYNTILLMDRALYGEKNKEIASQILEQSIKEATRNEDLLQITNSTYYINEMGNKQKSDSLITWAMSVVNKPYNLVNSYNIRTNYALNILAKRDSNYSEAWKVLDDIVTEISDINEGMILYYKGEISANYNYKSEEGVKFLLSAIKHKNQLYSWYFDGGRIYYLLAKCYYNINDKESAMQQLQKALNLSPKDEAYKELEKMINDK